MVLDYFSVKLMLETLTYSGSDIAAHEAQNQLQALQEFALQCDEMNQSAVFFENSLNEIIIGKLMRALIQYGSESDKRIVFCYLSNGTSSWVDC